MISWILSAHVLIIVVILIRAVFRHRISCRMRYLLWGLVMIRLLVPVSVGESPLSIMNLMPQREGEAGGYYEEEVLTGSDKRATDNTFSVSDDSNIRQQAADAEKRPSDAFSPANSEPAPNPPQMLSDSNSTATGTLSSMFGRFDSFFSDRVTTHSTLILGIWLTGSMLALAWILFVNLHFAIQVRRNRRHYMDLDCPIPIFITDRLISPCLFGIFHPAIYLTPQAIAPDARTEYVLAHELCHYHRKDFLWSLARGLCVAVWWWSPLVWLAAVLVRQDCEMSCDEMVLRQIGQENAVSYGKTLLDMIQPGQRFTLLCTATTMSRNARSMKERIVRITQRPRTTRFAASAAVILLLAGTLCACTGRVQKSEGDAMEPAETTVSTSAPSPESSVSAETPDSAEDVPPNSDSSELSEAGRTDLEMLVHDIILQQNYNEGDDGILPSKRIDVESHLVLGQKEEADSLTLYMWVRYEHYDWLPGIEIKAGDNTSGCHMPVALSLVPEKGDGTFYRLGEYWIPGDGAYYVTSIQEKFPQELWEQAIDSQAVVEEQEQDCLRQAREKAEEYEAFYESLRETGYDEDGLHFLNSYVKMVDSFDYAGICALTDGLEFDAQTQKKWTKLRNQGVILGVTADFESETEATDTTNAAFTARISITVEDAGSSGIEEGTYIRYLDVCRMIPGLYLSSVQPQDEESAYCWMAVAKMHE